MSKPPVSPEVAPTESIAPEAIATFHHVPVLVNEVIAGLVVQAGGTYLDVTLGGGGHTQALLDAGAAQVWGLDQDATAIASTTARLADYGDRFRAIHTNFADFKPKNQTFDGILADLGVSSVQFDRAGRGFSFRQAAPLDMRMDPRQSLTAADIVNTWDEQDLANLIYTYGEERLSRRIARRILERRPLESTTDLAEAIALCYPPKARYGRIHPATRTFQALRIAVNRELEVLETLLAQAPTWLVPGGRLGVISFHSLEDRRVKYSFRENPVLKVLTKKPIVATDAEIVTNGRSRSAKLRIAERLI